MRVPLSWLKDFTPLAVDATDRAAVGELGGVLDSLGLVVEGVEHVDGGLDGVLLAQAIELAPIPGADRIRRVTVDAGGSAPLEVVCGAWNFGPGDVVALATVGTTLPNGATIGRRTLRGVTSEGMLCSPPELGLPGDQGGLLVLAAPGEGAPPPAGIELGRPLAEHLGIEPDAVLDLSIEPNRPDCLSIAGVARDLAARLRLPFAVPEPLVEATGPPAAELAAVATRHPAACDRLLARVLTGVVAFPSPPAVARRLLLAGMRPLGAVVDASNYVMLELGQPTHPYDLDRLGGRAIVARLARPGERLVTLDGVERLLGRATDARGEEVEVDECVIADGEDQIVGLAGVMGGSASEVGPPTSRVLLEAAHFDPLIVGRAAKRRGLRTEASVRFERGVDPEGAARAADRVLQLVADAARRAGAPAPVVARGVLEDRPLRREALRLTLRTGPLNAVLGTSLAAGEAAGLLEPIGFSCEPDAAGLLVTVPSFRPDVTREIDLVEEVARHFGYERIPPTRRRSPAVGRLGPHQQARRRLVRLVAGIGALEAWSPSIVDPSLAARLGASPPPLCLVNPIVAEESALRSSLLPGLLAALHHNVAHRNPSLRLFEVGAVFHRPAPGEQWPEERTQLAVLLAREGDDAAAAVACWSRLGEGLGLDSSRVSCLQDAELEALAPADGLLLGLHPTRRGLLAGPEGPFGVLGEIDPAVVEAFEAGSRRVGVLLLDLDRLAFVPPRRRLAEPVSRFPSSDVDLAFSLPEEVPAGRLRAVLAGAGGDRCEWVRLLDVYRGPGLDPGSRSLAYRLRFRALDHTLDEAELAELRRRCIEAGESALPARLRA